jgi:transcription elongation factor SPT5
VFDGGDEENEGSRIAKSLLDELVELQTETDIGKLEKNKIDLIMGDMVEVVEGDLVGMRGKVLCIDRSTVKVKPTNAADLGETTEIEFLVNQVKKYIAVGVHVKVTSGRFSNETGLVVAVDKLNGERESTAIIVTDHCCI